MSLSNALLITLCALAGASMARMFEMLVMGVM